MITVNQNGPKFMTYGVYDARTGALVSEHGTRREAKNAANNHSHRVRGCRKWPR